eukprot:scaffold22588_cov122-Isochrysis_galbana.AAC.1
MTDPPTDDTEAREQDAPGATDAKHRAPVHGHTGDVPSHKALSDTHGRPDDTAVECDGGAWPGPSSGEC